MENRKIGIKLHKDREEILDFCMQHDRLFLYGSGKVGKAVFQYLAEEGVEVYAFCVSDKHKAERLFCGKEVYELAEIVFEEKDGIILGVSEPLQQEICKNLKDYGVLTEDIYIQEIYFNNAGLKRVEKYPDRMRNGKDTYFGEYVQLDQIGRQYGTDKCSAEHDYLSKYEFFLNKWKNERINILELGVYKGSSIRMWGSYFSNAAVYGVDISQECVRYEGENRKVLIQDLGDEDGLERLGSLNPTIIIDDASHVWSHQIKALYHLLPALQRGGVYILEDLGTSFFSYERQFFADSVATAYDFCSAIAEVVASRAQLRTAHLQADLQPLKQEIEFLADQISMMSFIRESCIMIKK